VADARVIRPLGYVLLILLAAGCQRTEDAERRGRAFIEHARAVHGSPVLDHATVTFDFRSDRYVVERDGGLFRYTRHYTDGDGQAVQDVLSNDGATRTIGGHQIDLTERERAALETTVNSVVYFALLPYNLGDAAVRPRYLGADTVQGRPYDLVEVTFRQEGGGRDWDDRFLYWFDPQTGEMPYLAYRFGGDEGGTRFRAATNVRTVEGVRFADYLNYVADPDTGRLEAYPRLMEAGLLQLVSEVTLQDVRVEPARVRRPTRLGP
jgi:hypothetical protein